MSNMEHTPRLTAAERREQMLGAAMTVFGELGYSGATTDAIAQVAGVSQAYIVRTFGSKDNLFAEAVSRAMEQIMDTFRQATQGTTDSNVEEKLGKAYVKLVADRSILLTTMQAFQLGHHPRFGPLAREGMLKIFQLLHEEIGLGKQRAKDFIAQGMLINTILALHLSDNADDEDARSLISCIFNDSADDVINIMADQKPLTHKARRA